VRLGDISGTLKYLPTLIFGLVIGTALAVGCAGDDRPVVSLPVGGEVGSGGEPTAAGGEPATSNGGSAQAGEPGVEGGAPGSGGQPVLGGSGPGDAGAPASAGAGGETSVEAAPFAGPYGAVYVGPVIGVDTRFPTATTWSAGELVGFVELDEEHAIGSALNVDTGTDGLVQWGRWASGKLGADESNVTLNADQGFHYAIGQLTPTLPASGTVSYKVVGHTDVTLGDGSKPSTDLLAAEATASFGATTKVGVTINPVIDGVEYVVVTTGTYNDPSTSEFTTWDAEHPARLGGVPPAPSEIPLAAGEGICADGCSASLQGFFAGPNAEHLVIVVHLFDGAGGSPSSVSSVIVMKKQ
jgi:hypothetical protein